MKRDEVKNRACVQYYQSPCGRLILASFDDALCLCDWYECPCGQRNVRRLKRLLRAELVESTSPVLEQTKRELDEYFAGKRRTFDVPLRMVGTDFQQSVWQALLEISYGAVCSYKEIAQRVNNVKGVRAVAQAIGANGICILIPCHRVIGSNHSLTGFAGGLEAKSLLLRVEGSRL